MFFFLASFDVARETQDFITVLLLIRPTQCQITTRVFVLHAVAGGAERFARAARARQPLPASLVIHRAAPRAHRRVAPFTLRLIGIVFEFLDEPVTAHGTGGSCGFSGCGSHGGALIIVVAVIT